MTIGRAFDGVLVAGRDARGLGGSMAIEAGPSAGPRDAHSFGNPDEVRVRHVELDLTVDFDREGPRGDRDARLSSGSRALPHDSPLILDTRGLAIEKVEDGSDGQDLVDTAEYRTRARPTRSSASRSRSRPRRRPAYVRVHYRTSPEAGGLAVARPGADGGQDAAVPVHAVARRSRRGPGSRSRTRRASG